MVSDIGGVCGGLVLFRGPPVKRLFPKPSWGMCVNGLVFDIWGVFESSLWQLSG